MDRAWCRQEEQLLVLGGWQRWVGGRRSQSCTSASQLSHGGLLQRMLGLYGAAAKEGLGWKGL